jgi:hypothetical protein
MHTLLNPTAGDECSVLACTLYLTQLQVMNAIFWHTVVCVVLGSKLVHHACSYSKLSVQLCQLTPHFSHTTPTSPTPPPLLSLYIHTTPACTPFFPHHPHSCRDTFYSPTPFNPSKPPLSTMHIPTQIFENKPAELQNLLLPQPQDRAAALN